MLMFTPDEREKETDGKRQKAEANSNRKTQNSKLASYNAQSSAQIELLPIKTIPSHFSQVYDASERDFRAVFGWEDDPHRRNFAIGQPIDMDVPICIDLDRFVERSNGVFGKSGTGKSF